MLDLNTLIPSDSPLLLRTAYSINDRGDIAGVARLKSDFSKRRAYLLIPDGDCDDDCESRIAASQTAAMQYPAAMKQEVESPTETVNQLRNLLRQQYHIPGQRSAPQD
jgi:hypothetical protein